MRVKRIYGALNIEFENGQCINFTIMDRECDRCMTGDCLGCEEVGKPWREYYQILKYCDSFEKTTYENDPTSAVKSLNEALGRYLQAKGDIENEEIR